MAWTPSERECRAYAERQGWQVVAVFEDWQTGTELFERAEMTRCREAMRRGDFDVLLVDRLDRLSRRRTIRALSAPRPSTLASHRIPPHPGPL